MPKAVYFSRCRSKHIHLWRDSNQGPLTPQSDALTTRLRDMQTISDTIKCLNIVITALLSISWMPFSVCELKAAVD